MIKIVCLVLLLALDTYAAVNVKRQSALDALAALPPDDATRLVKIAACEGRPDPERWHFIVYDSNAENGYREYVVAERRVVAVREVSQFASQVQPNDVIGAGAIRVDSNRAAWLARLYAQANNEPVYSLNYVLQKDSQTGLPVWQVTCLDRNDQSQGSLVVGADTERIVSQAGFPEAPVIPPTIAGEPLVNTRPGGFQPPTPNEIPRIDNEQNDRAEGIERRRAEPAPTRERRIVIDPFRILRGVVPF